MLLENAKRRDTLINLSYILEDEERIRKEVGKNCFVDMALFTYAQHDPDSMNRLHKYLNVKELQDDIMHTIESSKLKRRGKV